MDASKQNVVCFLSISEPKEKTVTRCKSYKFTLLNQTIIRSLWEIGHNFALKNQKHVRPMELERRFRGLPHDRISDIEDPKSQR